MADLFYGRLFLLEPSLEAKLGGERGLRTARFVEMLSALVGALSDQERLASLLSPVGEALREGQVSTLQCESMAATWLWTLEQVLGESLDPSTLSAWREACQLVLGVALGAAVSEEGERRTWLDGFPAKAGVDHAPLSMAEPISVPGRAGFERENETPAPDSRRGERITLPQGFLSIW